MGWLVAILLALVVALGFYSYYTGFKHAMTIQANQELMDQLDSEKAKAEDYRLLSEAADNEVRDAIKRMSKNTEIINVINARLDKITSSTICADADFMRDLGRIR